MNKRRLPAEWETQSMVQFTFPHADSDWRDILSDVLPCFVACVEAVSRFQDVLVVLPNEEAKEVLKCINKSRLKTVVCSSNDTWARDHGGITVLDDGHPIILDFIFNGWGLKFAANKDNQLTRRLSDRQLFGGAKRLQMELVLEGGAIETDGKGTLMTTSTCLLSPNRNPHLSKEDIESILKKELGVARFLWLKSGHLEGDDTDAHIDTLARFAPNDIIIYQACSNQEDMHYDELKLMEEELYSFRTIGGEGYELVALPWPDPCYADDGHRLPATYANFLIINGAVLVPTYDVPQDEQALRVIGQCFPEREVIGIDCRLLIEQHGSLHCISMQYPYALYNGVV